MYSPTLRGATEHAPNFYGSRQSPPDPFAFPEATDTLAAQLAATGDYEYVGVNLPWSTVLGKADGSGPLTSSARRPDVIAVRRDGKVDAFEIPSAGDDPDQLLQRMQEIRDTFPSHYQGIIDTKSIAEVLGS